MRFARKLLTWLLPTLAVVVAANAFWAFRAERVQVERRVQQDLHVLGVVLKRFVVEVWRTEGPEATFRLLSEANSAEPSVGFRWVWLDGAGPESERPRLPLERLRPVVEGRAVVATALDDEGERRRYEYLPLSLAPVRPAALEVSAALEPTSEHRAGMLLHVAVLALTVILGAAVVVVLACGSFLEAPARRLIEKARAVGEGDLSAPLPVVGDDELGDLARVLNETCGRLRESRERAAGETAARQSTLEQLRHADRLTTVGLLAAGLAHELGTPLNVVSGWAGTIESGRLTGGEVAAAAASIREQCERMAGIIRQLLGFARTGRRQKGRADLVVLARRTLELLAPLARQRDATLRLGSCPAAALVAAPVAALEQALANLVVNALQAVPRGGTVQLALVRDRVEPPPSVGGAPGDYWALVVEDDGEGIAPEDLRHIFDPFFTTKEPGKGTGLGLSVAYGIARESDGWIDVQSEPRRGSRFSLWLPVELVEVPAAVT